MKNILINIMFVLLSINVIGYESQCDCIELGISEENWYNCDTTFFDNGAYLYWQLNCDSTWLTFEYQQKIILKSCEKEMQLECKRSGLSFIKEYPNYLLFIYEWISGCCVPPDLVFISKENGLEINRVDNDLFVWGNGDLNYALFFFDTSYTNLIYLNHLTDRQYSYKFEKGKVDESARKNSVFYIEDLFNNVRVNRDLLEFNFINTQGKVEELSFKIN